MMLPFHTVTDIEGRLTDVAEEFCAFLRMNRGELIGRDILTITHPADRGDTEVDMRRLRDERQSFSILKRYIRSDGNYVWATAKAVFATSRRGEVFVRGRIEQADANAAIASRRQRDFAIFEALEALGREELQTMPFRLLRLE